MSARYLRREPLDALEVDGEALLLLPPDQVVRLSPIGTAIFAASAGPTAVEAIAVLIEAEFGAPGDGDALAAVSEFCADLARAGVLERVADE